MRRALGLILLSVLVVLTGCSGVFGGSGEPTETVTPAAVPTDEPTPTPAPRLAPGITEQGIVSPRALVVAHQSFLQNRSFTRRSNSTALAANGSTVLRTTSSLRAGPPGEGLYSVIERNGSYVSQESATISTRSEAWWDGGQYVVRRTFSNGTTTYGQPSNSVTRANIGTGTLPYLLESFGTNDTTVTDRLTRNGTTLYRVEGTSDGPRQPNTTLRLLVDSRGVVHEYTTIRQLSTGPAVSRSVTKTRLVAINETDAPERPSWVDDALNQTTSTASSGTELAG
ncbi:hypothetical protein [Halococcus sp. AFM35]|uniref:hypothetical protein n=1 Tax=Halococcus sp. AFM35 TaxID=3421653 RepID=UPI003EBBBDEC